MNVKKVNAFAVRIGSHVVPACNIDLDQDHGSWTAYFEASALIGAEQTPVNYSCVFNSDLGKWQVVTTMAGLPPVEQELTDAQLVGKVNSIAAIGQFSGKHQEIFDAAYALAAS